jgi:hypothetical protein
MDTKWTIAFRKPRANRFQRVTNWYGTWDEAMALATVFAEANPELQVFYVPFLGSEHAEDAGTVLADSGKRVRIIDNAELSGDMLAIAVDLLMDEALHTNSHYSQIVVNKGWNCCEKAGTKVIVFSNGARWIACTGCARSFRGTVEDLPGGTTHQCADCDVITWGPFELISTEEENETSDSDKIENIDSFLSLLESTLKPLTLRATQAENHAYAIESDEAEQWTTISKDLRTALSNVGWMLDYRANQDSRIYS